MKNFKNFRLTEPTEAQIELYKNDEGIIPFFLTSEDGQDWYECQSLFADETIKLEYDVNGVIYNVVDKPVPARGNILAASMLWPENASVAEVEMLPEGFSTNGTWVYAGGAVVQNLDLVIARNRRSQIRRAGYATAMLSMLQACQSTGCAQNGDADRIFALQQYLSDLRNIDLSQTIPGWPELPEGEL